MSIVLLGSTSGSVTLSEPAVAGSTVIDLPATSGTMAVTSGSPSFTNITATGTLTVNGNTTLGDASTDTILMTGAPSIGGAGLGMGMGFRNRIINGAMVIDQRNAGASVTPTITTYPWPYSLDRWTTVETQASKFSIQQNAGAVTPPVGFKNYLGITVGASANVTVGAADIFEVRQPIEGLNIADFGWGASGAATITLSFWVRSSLTGTFGGALGNANDTRSYPYTYTISAANTWEQKTITIAGDTSGTWLTTNGIGINVVFGFGVGSTYSGTAGAWAGTFYASATGAVKLIETNSATFYITGVQLEKGSTATSFDYRPYGTELALCQRYLPAYNGIGFVGTGHSYATTVALIFPQFQTPPRIPPTGITVANPTNFQLWDGSGGLVSLTALSAYGQFSYSGAALSATVASGLTVGRGTALNANNSNCQILFTGCEL